MRVILAERVWYWQRETVVLSHTQRVVLAQREWCWHKETEFMCVALVERVELAEGYRQTDRQTEICWQREWSWHRERGTGRERHWPQRREVVRDVTGCDSPGYAGGLWPTDPRST